MTIDSRHVDAQLFDLFLRLPEDVRRVNVKIIGDQ